MLLLIIRHAIAVEREEFARSGQDDSLRPLTDEGRAKMRKVTQGLTRLIPGVDVLATSNLTRATETAAIVATAYDGMEAVVVDALSPERQPAAFLQWLRGQKLQAVIAAVGHEPHLGTLASWLLAGKDRSFITFKKGGICLLEFARTPRAGDAALHWLLTPRQLRDLAR